MFRFQRLRYTSETLAPTGQRGVSYLPLGEEPLYSEVSSDVYSEVDSEASSAAPPPLQCVSLQCVHSLNCQLPLSAAAVDSQLAHARLDEEGRRLARSWHAWPEGEYTPHTTPPPPH